jgi:hypothetical protein
MTEREWLECDDPNAILKFVCGQAASERKLRLFAIACCRTYWHLLRKKQMRSVRRLVLTAESYAEGEATEESLDEALASVKCPRRGEDVGLVEKLAFTASCISDPHVGVGPQAAAEAAAWETSRWAADSGLIVPEVQAALLRDIFSFSLPQPMARCCLTWRDGMVSVTAEEMYRSRDFNDSPVLADMLDEAGCTDEALLSHLRSPGPHVRGCWALDLLLGKG